MARIWFAAPRRLGCAPAGRGRGGDAEVPDQPARRCRRGRSPRRRASPAASGRPGGPAGGALVTYSKVGVSSGRVTARPGGPASAPATTPARAATTTSGRRLDRRRPGVAVGVERRAPVEDRCPATGSPGPGARLVGVGGRDPDDGARGPGPGRAIGTRPVPHGDGGQQERGEDERPAADTNAVLAAGHQPHVAAETDRGSPRRTAQSAHLRPMRAGASRRWMQPAPKRCDGAPRRRTTSGRPTLRA